MEVYKVAYLDRSSKSADDMLHLFLNSEISGLNTVEVLYTPDNEISEIKLTLDACMSCKIEEMCELIRLNIIEPDDFSVIYDEDIEILLFWFK